MAEVSLAMAHLSVQLHWDRRSERAHYLNDLKHPPVACAGMCTGWASMKS